MRALFTGFRAQGSKFRVSGAGFKDSDLRLRLLGFGFRAQGSKFRVSGSGCKVSGFGLSVQGFGFRAQDFRFRVSGSGFRVSESKTLGCGTCSPAAPWRACQSGLGGCLCGAASTWEQRERSLLTTYWSELI